ncbi:MAG TPA: enoyl-CoA hydratase-related protein [Myxococcota bacterium]|nr:enoyl-CoA hydratase-related protein [Myxococcota bacterium]HQK51307.1 enoyl-CoA hydratase-related protein [Myxococcota bacterium]
MSWETVEWTIEEDRIAVLTIRREKALNALNRQVLGELDQAIGEMEGRPDLGCVVVTGAGTRAFVAGADIAEMAPMGPSEALAFARQGQGVFSRLERLPVPVIAAVQGHALGGGCELVLCCDIVLASDRAVFGQPEVKLGVIPGFGGTARLARRIGYGAAMQWILTGGTVGAEEAHRLGLVQRVVPGESLRSEALELAREIASRGPLAVRAAKALVREARDRPLGDALEAEAQAFGGLFATHDQREGMAAFLEKRPARFQGR